MTKKHYIAIAEIIRNEANQWKETSLPARTVSDIAYKLADYFATDNPRFNRERFIEACRPE